jgi:hypothetical protein
VQILPDYVQLQVLHQLAVTGKQAADVAVLICGQDLRVHRIERDEAVISQLIDVNRAERRRHRVSTEAKSHTERREAGYHFVTAFHGKRPRHCFGGVRGDPVFFTNIDLRSTEVAAILQGRRCP